MVKYPIVKRSLILIFFVVFLAFILRIYQLGAVPIALNWDEVAIGYDSYSLLNTGKDQFGHFLPLTFRSLDDYKPPIYEYLAIPSIAVFGLNSFAVRLPSAICGVFAVIGVYFLVKEIETFRSNKNRIKPDKLALITAFLLAISPWHLQFSRAAFEVNISLFFTTLAVFFFLKGLKNSKFYPVSAIFFGLNFFSYHSSRVVIPLIIVALFVVFNRQLDLKRLTYKFLSIVAVFFIIFIPILISPQAQIRFTATNIFKPGARYLDEKDLEKIFLDKRLFDANHGYILDGKIFHNQRFIYMDYDTLKKAFSKYIANFGFEHLFIKGDAPLHHAPDFGLLYLWEFPFLLLFIFLLFKFYYSKYIFFIFIWLLIAPVPVAVTRESPHAVRALLMLPSIQILIALGLYSLLIFLKTQKKWLITGFIILLICIQSISFSYYLHQYYVHTNLELSENWKYGREEAVKITEKYKNNYDEVIVSLNVDMPYIFWLFYTKYSPSKYLEQGGTISGGFADERNKFDKYFFKNFTYKELPKDKKILLVGTNKDFPTGAKIISEIKYLNGKTGIIIGENIN
jgi:4-amino-4-deoxy-L-arabinose transferase-like glycosyltransferase